MAIRIPEPRAVAAGRDGGPDRSRSTSSLKPRRTSAAPTNSIGMNSARLLACASVAPNTIRSTETATTTSTSRGDHEGSTGQRQVTSRAPLAAAKRAASSFGDPTDPNGRNVTGAAASAAASAAADAWRRAAMNPPTSANNTASTTARPPTASSNSDMAPSWRLTAPLASPTSPAARSSPRRTTAPPACGEDERPPPPAPPPREAC